MASTGVTYSARNVAARVAAQIRLFFMVPSSGRVRSRKPADLSQRCLNAQANKWQILRLRTGQDDSEWRVPRVSTARPSARSEERSRRMVAELDRRAAARSSTVGAPPWSAASPMSRSSLGPAPFDAIGDQLVGGGGHRPGHLDLVGIRQRAAAGCRGGGDPHPLDGGPAAAPMPPTMPAWAGTLAIALSRASGVESVEHLHQHPVGGLQVPVGAFVVAPGPQHLRPGVGHQVALIDAGPEGGGRRGGGGIGLVGPAAGEQCPAVDRPDRDDQVVHAGLLTDVDRFLKERQGSVLARRCPTSDQPRCRRIWAVIQESSAARVMAMDSLEEAASFSQVASSGGDRTEVARGIEPHLGSPPSGDTAPETRGIAASATSVSPR